MSLPPIGDPQRRRKTPSATAKEPRMVDNQKDLLGRNRVIGLKNATAGVNPKDKIGAAKVDLTLIPSHAQVQLALALMDGGTKYGPYNWRVEPVQIRTYIGAAQRHLLDYLDGEEVADDSLVHHLGHVMACCAIIMDAVNQGKAVDDRPITHGSSGASLSITTANKFIKETKPAGWGR